MQFPSNVHYGDIVKGLPIAENSADFVYCSHVLEHLSLEDCRMALRNTFKILKPNGIFRCVLPDLEYEAKNYSSNTDSEASILFLKRTGLGQDKRKYDLLSMLREFYGNSKYRWMWDYKSLSSELKAVGFNSVRRAYFNDSSYDIFKTVETESRWENALGIEAKKCA
nr:methyltransferase domain-containing protein [Methylacidiphilum kamchatkense]